MSSQILQTAKPRLQIALDTFDLPAALGPLQVASDFVDVIEVGTVLCLCEGMRAVREIRALFPRKPILADIRIAGAGGILSRLAFEAGADWVSTVSGASDTTISSVCKVARDFGGQVQVELGEGYSLERAARWREVGVEHVIVKRSRDGESQSGGSVHWGSADRERIRELSALGFQVTVTGGVSRADLKHFVGLPVAIFIVGRGVVQAELPAQAAEQLQAELRRLWPQGPLQKGASEKS